MLTHLASFGGDANLIRCLLILRRISLLWANKVQAGRSSSLLGT